MINLQKTRILPFVCTFLCTTYSALSVASPSTVSNSNVPPMPMPLIMTNSSSTTTQTSLATAAATYTTAYANFANFYPFANAASPQMAVNINNPVGEIRYDGCYIAIDKATLPIFVPMNTQAEWESFKTSASDTTNLTYTFAGATPCSPGVKATAPVVTTTTTSKTSTLYPLTDRGREAYGAIGGTVTFGGTMSYTQATQVAGDQTLTAAKPTDAASAIAVAAQNQGADESGGNGTDNGTDNGNSGSGGDRDQ